MRLYRSSFFALLFASTIVFATASASADATSDMVATMQNFASVHSYHCDILASRGTVSMDMVAPDKFHMTMNGKMQLIKIGSDMWMNMGGAWQQMPQVGAMMQRPMDLARGAGMQGHAPSDYAITDLGPALLDGMPTHKYHMVGKDGSTVDMWVAKSLPVQVQASGKEGTATIKYSQYNSVPDITPPV